MNVENTEINGFVIDKFNQHGLEEVRPRVYALGLPNVGNLKIGRKNVLLMIGNVVSVLVITVTIVFNYIRTNVKVVQLKNIQSLNRLKYSSQLKTRQLNGLRLEAYHQLPFVT